MIENAPVAQTGYTDIRPNGIPTQKPASAKAKVYGAMIGVGGAVANNITGTAKFGYHLLTSPVNAQPLADDLYAIGRDATQTNAERIVNTSVSMYQQYGDLPEAVQETAIYAHLGTDVAIVASPFMFKTSVVASEAIEGAWVSESTAGWSSKAIAYQEYVTGVKAGNAFEVAGVRFDGALGGKLLEAKSSYDNFVSKSGDFY